MLVCSCNIISKAEIEEVIIGFLDADPWDLITPARVYHDMERRGRCCGCFPNVINIIIATTENYHRARNHSDAEVVPFIAKIKEHHAQCETARKLMQAKTRAIRASAR